MGAEAMCRARYGRQAADGTARLEADNLHFRGGNLRLSIPFKAITKIAARGGWLSVTSPEGTAAFELGTAAAKWAEKIAHPPSRLEKVGVRPDWRVSAVGVDEPSFLRELQGAVALLSIGRVAKESDAIFLGATRAEELSRMAALKAALKPNGAIWVIRPKGRPEISERAVMAAGRAAGLVDVKVVSLSATHTAEKFVIPVAKRSQIR
jgi:hypothetical protein